MIGPLPAIDPWTLAAFLGACVALMLTPGPNMMFSIACGIAGGPRAGIAAGAGAAAGMLVHTLLAAAGVSAVVMAEPAAYDALRWAGAAYLAWLAWASWRAGDAPAAARGRAEARRAFLRGLATNLTNPKVILFMIAFLPQFADPAAGPLWRQLLVLGAIVSLTALVFDAAYGALAGAVSDRLRAASRLMNRVSAVVFGALAARLAIS